MIPFFVAIWFAPACSDEGGVGQRDVSTRSEADADADADGDADGDADADADTDSDPLTDYTSDWGLEMIAVPPGAFCMACGKADPIDNQVDHTVTFSRAVWLARTETTEAQWARWEGASPPHHEDCDTCPAEIIGWADAALYANALSGAEGLPACYEPDGSDLIESLDDDPYACDGYRLPTEAEWEYAARAGVDTAFSGGDAVRDVAWTSYSEVSTSQGVAGLAENAWGFYDMSGNVIEWTGDWYAAPYAGDPITDPAGATSGTGRCARGGAWWEDPVWARVAYRFYAEPDFVMDGMGFRLARSVP